VSCEPGLKVVFEPRVGGRIFERTTAGREIEWGEITLWDPPRRLRYLWHLRSDRADATDVEIVFTEFGHSSTRVEIEHSGWDRLGAAADRRDANRRGWEGVLAAYVAACQGEAAPATHPNYSQEKEHVL
jgi:hypothetical protein